MGSRGKDGIKGIGWDRGNGWDLEIGREMEGTILLKGMEGMVERSTGQMKYRWESLTSKLSMKTLIKLTETLPRE